MYNFISTFDELNKLYEADKAAARAKNKIDKEAAAKALLGEEAVDEGIIGDTIRGAVKGFLGEEAEEEIEEPRQVICECDKCGALVIKAETDIVVDEESDLVNVEEECQFCEEANGYKIIGAVAPYEAVPEEAEEIEDEVEELEEILDVNVDADLRDFAGTGNKVSVLNPGLESLDREKDEEDLEELLDANLKIDAKGFGGENNDVSVL